MKRVLLALAVVAMLAGCSAKANRDDFFGYMKRPLFASGFDLASARAAPQSQQFFVEDGSIGQERVQVWVNATAGSATVQIFNPRGQEVLRTGGHADELFPLELGAWRVVVTGSPDAAGHVGVLVTRG